MTKRGPDAQSSTEHDFQGRTLVDHEGQKIGKVDELYYDEAGGQPEWALVNTGMFGTKKTFVPIRSATPAGEDLQVPVTKDQVNDAPRVDADEELSEQEERALFEHYGVPYVSESSATQMREHISPDAFAGALQQLLEEAAEVGRQAERAASSAGEEVRRPPQMPDVGARISNFRRKLETELGLAGAGGADRDAIRPDEAMLRSEEELHVGTTERESGRVRLRKYVVTENVETTVPVRREEVRVEREPITDENRDQALSGAEISEEEHEVVLHAEEPVVEKRTVAKERVRLGTETHQDEREISEEVRKEQIEVDDSQRRGR